MLLDEQEASWTLDNAQANLAEVIEQARVRPQMIVRNGATAVVVVSAEEWASKNKGRETLAEFMRNSPLANCDLDLERIQDEPRDVSF